MIYRVHAVAHETDAYGSDGSIGYGYFGSKADAEAERRRLHRERGIPMEDITIESVPTPKTKAEIIALLRSWGSHPNNG